MNQQAWDTTDPDSEPEEPAKSETTGDRFVIEGGSPISGTVTASGNKNEALPMLAAALLVRGPVTIENLPKIDDVATLIAVIQGLGAAVDVGEHAATVDASGLSDARLDPALARGIRGSFLLAAPLLARLGEVTLPQPGGDRIGRRRVDTHLLALQQLGAEVRIGDAYRLALPGGRFRGAEVFLDETSVTGTETAVMAAAVADGSTRILNAASEPHVQGLCHALAGMGARIRGIGSNVLDVDGIRDLRPVRHRLSPDHIEIGSLAAIAAMTGGELRIPDIVPDHLRMIRLVYERLGVETRIDGTTLVVPSGQKRAIVPDVGGMIPKVDDAPWPGFPADLTSLALVLATQCEGTVLIHEKLFESRLFFVDRLIAMGARIVLCDPHRAVVIGPSRLSGAEIVSPDIRAGMALVGAALCAHGVSVIHNVRQVDRGYERIDERLCALGARLTRRR